MFQSGLLNSRSQQVVSSPSSIAKSNSILILDEVYNKHGILLLEVNEFQNRNRARNVSADYSIICRKIVIVQYFLNDWKQQYCISIFAFPHRNQKCPCKTFWLLIYFFRGWQIFTTHALLAFFNLNLTKDSYLFLKPIFDFCSLAQQMFWTFNFS